MHCNLRPPEPHQLFAALITMPCQVWCHRTYPLQCNSVFAADTLLYDVTFTSDPVTLTFDLEYMQCIACDVMKLCIQIWTQSNNPRRSYCDFSVWPYDLEHVLSVALGSGIIFTKFDFRRIIRAWIIVFLMLICYVTLWSSPMTRWPWKFVVHQASRDQSLYKIWAKSSNPRLNYW